MAAAAAVESAQVQVLLARAEMAAAETVDLEQKAPMELQTLAAAAADLVKAQIEMVDLVDLVL